LRGQPLLLGLVEPFHLAAGLRMVGPRMRRCQVVCVNTSMEVSIDDGCCGIRTWGVGGAWAGV
jgi:hypothetical protein